MTAESRVVLSDVMWASKLAEMSAEMTGDDLVVLMAENMVEV